MRPTLAALLAVLLGAGCGVPQELSKQAEQVASTAAEGALLAAGAADGSTTSAFTRVHAEALHEQLAPLEPAVEDERLARVLDRVLAALDELAAAPGSGTAARLERVLEASADAASRIAG